ncbi:MAG: cytochrome c biogenesis protein ResB [Propionibacteriaceae bacterium]|nr:cytochrome c biogenesis protein ResB [Micropruina sp.]
MARENRPSNGPAELAPALGPVATLRWLWTQLTSMKTALWLLFALAVAAMPGSFLPQRPVNPVKVSDYIKANPGVGPWLDRLGFFDVFAAPWFGAIYVLLFVSLVGCIVPRIWVYLRELRNPPPAVPASLAKLTGYRTGVVTQSPAEVLDAAAASLKAKGFRVRREADAVSGDKGFLRELGNLVFHLALVIVLCGLGWNALASFRGTSIIVEGGSFSNTLTQYDEFTSGAAFRPSSLTPFSFRLDSFDVKFTPKGAPSVFDAKVTTDGATKNLEVNSPLTFGNTEVHLLGNGYAPVVKVLDGNGNVAFSGPAVFLPQDGMFTSAGTIKAQDGRPERLAFDGLFLPTVVPGSLAFVSSFPDALNPQLLVGIWHGPPKVETGTPENIYTLDTTGLTKVTDADGKTVRARLNVGDTFAIPGGGSISFTGWQRWAKVQVSTNPGLWIVGIGFVLALAGIACSLLVRPRRAFVRVGAVEGGTSVQLGGIDRVDGRPAVDAELATLASAVGISSETLATTEGDPA